MLLVPVIINSTAISLSWGEVNCTERNGAITGYSVQYSIVGGIQSTTVNVTGDVTSIVISRLTEFTIYTVSVAAINDNGIGPYTDGLKVFTGRTFLYSIAVYTVFFGTIVSKIFVQKFKKSFVSILFFYLLMTINTLRH